MLSLVGFQSILAHIADLESCVTQQGQLTVRCSLHDPLHWLLHAAFDQTLAKKCQACGDTVCIHHLNCLMLWQAAKGPEAGCKTRCRVHKTVVQRTSVSEVAAGPVTLSRNQRSEQEQYHHHLNGTSQTSLI